jgi:hypothetical protein
VSASLDWRTAEVGTIGPTIYTRFYMRYTAFPLVTHNRVMYLLTGVGAQRAALLINANDGTGNARKFGFSDGSNSFGTPLSTVQLAANTTYRFEAQWILSTTAGSVIINCYLGDSTTVLDTVTASNQNFAGTSMGSPSWGYNDARANTDYVGTLYMDGFAIGTTDWFGPIITPNVPFIYV